MGSFFGLNYKSKGNRISCSFFPTNTIFLHQITSSLNIIITLIIKCLFFSNTFFFTLKIHFFFILIQKDKYTNRDKDK